MTFSELQLMINAHRKTQGLPIKQIPEQIRLYEDQVSKYQKQRDQAIKDRKTPQEITDIDKLLEPAKRRLQHEIQKYQGR
jgi:DNA-binding transcriptional MerR regulator